MPGGYQVDNAIATFSEAARSITAKEPVANRIVRRLDDGSYLAKFGDGTQALTVRVIEYTPPGSTTIYSIPSWRPHTSWRGWMVAARPV